jgi:hypothetical protein
MDGKTEGEGSRPVFPGFAGKRFVAFKILPVPGAGGAGYGKTPAFLLRERKNRSKIRRVSVGVAGHSV